MSPQAPRNGHVKLGGIPWLARMIDKARLDAAGTITALDLEYPCPIDRSLLNELGIDAQTFQAIVTAAETDEAILQALEQRGILLKK
ncbi:MAG: DUF5069 domain-containing protein [Candidatus Melainabacteria bacterium]|nr:DUF5069 domain-containing protein [Candidatus Melainabacteria bacterium]